MDWTADPTALFATALIPVQILFVDLLLSADNALLIALASRGLPEADMRKAALIGTLCAICLRVAMGSVALFLMRVPFLRIVAGIVLIYIAIKLTLDQHDPDIESLIGGDAVSEDDARRRNRQNLLNAIWAIIVADATMSLDNVLAVAAIAKDSIFLLGFGLLMSIPMLVWGSTLIRTFLNQNKYLVLWAGAFLGWIAGGIIITDPLVASGIDVYAPAVSIVLPVATALFVIVQNLVISRLQATSGGTDDT